MRIQRLAVPAILVALFAVTYPVQAQDARDVEYHREGSEYTTPRTNTSKAFEGKGDPHAVEAALSRANKQAQQTKKNKAAKAACAYCGEEIISKGQHCQAKDAVGLCSTVKETPRQELVRNEYTGGDPHAVKEDVKAPAKTTKAIKAVCAYCGEEIISKGQHCQAKDAVGLCSTVKETPRQEVIRNEYTSGDPHAVKEDVKAPAKTTKAAKAVCAECGEDVLSAGQHCKDSGYTTLCSSVKETKKDAVVSNDYEGGDPHRTK